MILLKDVSCEWEDGRTALKNINLEIKKEKSVFELSSGQKQKIAIASIYSMSPKVLILDDPSANLDMKATFDLFSILEK